MTKAEIVEDLKTQLREKYERAVAAVKDAAEGATGDDSKAESKYDTRGLESSYLAAGQVEQAERLARELAAIEVTDFSEVNREVEAGSLVEGELDGRQVYYLIAPGGGGLTVEAESGKSVIVIGGGSPLGSQMLGKQVGEMTDQPQIRIAGFPEEV